MLVQVANPNRQDAAVTGVQVAVAIIIREGRP